MQGRAQGLCPRSGSEDGAKAAGAGNSTEATESFKEEMTGPERCF